MTVAGISKALEPPGGLDAARGAGLLRVEGGSARASAEEGRGAKSGGGCVWWGAGAGYECGYACGGVNIGAVAQLASA